MTNLIITLLAVLLPVPKQIAYNGQSCPESMKPTIQLVERIPEAGRHQDEAYRLKVCSDGIKVEAVTPIGIIRAQQTLEQLLDDGVYEGCSITDWAAFPVRGFMHDVGRGYISIDELKREIDILAKFKINVFHWHLTENQAWRLESKVHPQVNAPETMARFPGEFYTQEEAKELVRFCAERGVTLIPEIDMPGLIYDCNKE